MSSVLNVRSALSTVRLLSDEELRTFFKRFLETSDQRTLDIFYEVIAEHNGKGKLWKWVEGRLRKDFSLTPLSLTKETRKRFGLPRSAERMLYIRIRAIKQKIRMQFNRQKKQVV